MSHTHTHTHRNMISHQKNEILPFAARWMDLEIITLSEIKSERERQIPYYHLYVESKLQDKSTYPQNKNRFIDIENRLWLPRGREVEERRNGNLGLADTNYYIEDG